MAEKRYKYPRTKHFAWTEHMTTDDKIHDSVEHFIGEEVVVTEKLDGEGTTVARDYVHARATDSKDHISRHPMKNLWGQIKREIPTGWRLCGENLAAEHSIHYYTNRQWFYVFGIFNENNVCLSWDDTVEFCQLLGLPHVPVLWRGIWDESKVKACYTGKSTFVGSYDVKHFKDTGNKKETQEGYVVRVTKAFEYPIGEDSERICLQEVGKFVRRNHVQTTGHWMTAATVWND